MGASTRHLDLAALDELSQDDWEEISLYGKKSFTDKYHKDPIRCQIHGFLMWLKDRDKYLIKGTDLDHRLH